MVPFKRALVSSYRLPIVTFPLSLHVSEILPLLCSRTRFFPTPPLVTPKFPHVPLGVGGWPLGYEDRSSKVLGMIIKEVLQPGIADSTTKCTITAWCQAAYMDHSTIMNFRHFKCSQSCISDFLLLLYP